MPTTTYSFNGETLSLETTTGAGTLTGQTYLVFRNADSQLTGSIGNTETTDDNLSVIADKSELVLKSDSQNVKLVPGANKTVKIDITAGDYADDVLNGDANDIPNREYVDRIFYGTSVANLVQKGGDTMTGNLHVKHGNWPTIQIESTAATDANLSLKSQNNDNWTIRNDDSESNRLEIRINNSQRAYISTNLSSTSRWGNLYQNAGETRLGTFLSGDNDIRLRFNSGTGSHNIGFEIKRHAGETTGNVAYINTGTGNHTFYSNGTNSLNIQGNHNVTMRGNLYLGFLDSTAKDQVINICSEAGHNTTAYIRRDSGTNGALEIVNHGTGTFNFYTNNKKVLRAGSNGSLTTHRNLHLGWNNQSTDEDIKLVFNSSTSTPDNAYIRRAAGTDGVLELRNLGAGYTYINTGNILYLRGATGMVYRSGTGVHSFEDDYIEHADHPNWTAFGTFNNSWGNYGSGFQDCEYYKDAMGFVHLRGLLHRVGTSHPNSVVKILPTGYRPANREIFNGSAAGTNGRRRIDIYASGDILVHSGDGDYISLAGITFYVG